MGRKSLEDNIIDGCLTVSNIRQLTNYSIRLIKSWCEKKLIEGASKIPGTEEWRIPGLGLLTFLQNSNLRCHADIVRAAQNYRTNYNASGGKVVLAGSMTNSSPTEDEP